MVVIIQRREMVDRVVEKEGSRRDGTGKHKEMSAAGTGGVGWRVTRQPCAECWDPNQPAQEAETQSLQGPFFLKKKKRKEKHIPFPSTPEGCCFAGASPEAVMGVRETASGSSAASSPITPPTAWRTMKSLSEIAERRCRNRG